MAKKRDSRKKRAPESLVLHDSEGRPRIVLCMLGQDECPTLQFNDEKGVPRAMLQVGPGGRAVFGLLDDGGGSLVGLGADARGEVGVSITRPGNVPVLSLGWNAEEGLPLSVWGHDGRPMWQGFEPVIRPHPEGAG